MWETDSSHQASAYLRVSDNLNRTVKQLEHANDAQKLLIKSLQDELGEEAEFDPYDAPPSTLV
jgi:hypothetical protein